jgi:hypothetical protein
VRSSYCSDRADDVGRVTTSESLGSRVGFAVVSLGVQEVAIRRVGDAKVVLQDVQHTGLSAY